MIRLPDSSPGDWENRILVGIALFNTRLSDRVASTRVSVLATGQLDWETRMEDARRIET